MKCIVSKMWIPPYIDNHPHFENFLYIVVYLKIVDSSLYRDKNVDTIFYSKCLIPSRPENVVI